MSHSWDEIRGIMEFRRSADSALKQQMIDIRDRYNGDYVIPLPSVEGSPELEPVTPNLIADGIDGSALYAASTRPTIGVPALDPAKLTGVRSREYAAIRRKAYYATWHESMMQLLIRKAYRHMFGYGEHAMMVVPDFALEMPKVELRDPLSAYPEERVSEDIRRPKNVGFIFGRSGDWIVSTYPDEARDIVSRWGEDRSRMWDLVEWIDEDDIVIGVIGPREVPSWRSAAVREGEFSTLLRRWPNRAGRVPGAVSRRVTLDRVASQMSNIVGTVDMLAKLMALDVLAAEKAIFPDRFVVGQDGRPPQLLSGKWKDGRTGETNILTDIAQIGELQSSPGPLTHPVLDRLESAARQSGGIHPFMSGINQGTGLRTGRAIDSFGSFSYEPRIAEAQEIMGLSLTLVNEAIHDVYTGYWKSKKYHIFSGWPSDKGLVDFTPETHFESPLNVVTYDFPGADPQSAAVTIAQLVGAEMMSKHTGMQRHPWIEDAEGEIKVITEESIDRALLASVEQAAATGAIPVIDLARIKQLIANGESIDQAIIKADEEARERQVTQAPAPAEGQVAAPEAAPGLAPPGVGAEQPAAAPPEAISEPDQSLQNFRQLLVSLRQG